MGSSSDDDDATEIETGKKEQPRAGFLFARKVQCRLVRAISGDGEDHGRDPAGNSSRARPGIRASSGNVSEMSSLVRTTRRTPTDASMTRGIASRRGGEATTLIRKRIPVADRRTT